MTLQVQHILVILLLPVLMTSHIVLSQGLNALEQCRAQSQNLDQVHACMDGYLDVMDGDVRAITDFLNESLTGDSLAGFDRSQQAFIEYRRQNCLWYLEFSSPREEAEQIAKNCLANMSRHRLQELQDLVTSDNQSGQTIAGFYSYTAELNSFQPCDSDDRYWVEGAPADVGLMQQSYLSAAADSQELLHVILVGKLDTQLQAPEGHQGVLVLSNLIDLREPTKYDCKSPNRGLSAEISTLDVGETEQIREVTDDEQIEQEEPEQQLTAYFGAWLVDCVEISDRKSCSLQAALSKNIDDAQSAITENDPRLIINRTPKLSTFLELEFPSREIDSPTLIRWQVDKKPFGDIVESQIRVDEQGTRQILSESPFLDDELLPSLVKGRQVSINVLKSVDNENGDMFVSTLSGLTKALVFADDFVR